MISVICWKWKPRPGAGAHQHFNGQHVNVLRNMVKRNYPQPHRFICITDDPAGIDPDIEVLPLWKDHAGLASPMGPAAVSCYRRLRMFSREAAEWFGPRFVSVDLDCVILADMRPVWDRPEDFVIWGDTAKGTPYNGSMILMTAGTRAQVWDDFDPVASPLVGRKLGYIGSDQAWIAACLGPNEAKWTRRDGVLSFRNEVSPMPHLAIDARVVFFHGRRKPWDQARCGVLPWVAAHYR